MEIKTEENIEIKKEGINRMYKNQTVSQNMNSPFSLGFWKSIQN